MQHVEAVVRAVLDGLAWKATKYVSPRLVIRASQKRYKRSTKMLGTRDNADIVLTIGRPNYLERKFILQAKLAGEPFPIKKIQLRQLPKRRAA